jgi:hypothetical protein
MLCQDLVEVYSDSPLTCYRFAALRFRVSPVAIFIPNESDGLAHSGGLGDIAAEQV